MTYWQAIKRACDAYHTHGGMWSVFQFSPTAFFVARPEDVARGFSARCTVGRDPNTRSR